MSGILTITSVFDATKTPPLYLFGLDPANPGVDPTPPGPSPILTADGAIASGAIGRRAITASPQGGEATMGSPGVRQAARNWLRDNVTFTAQGVKPNNYESHDGFSRIVCTTNSTFTGSMTIEAVCNGQFSNTIVEDSTLFVVVDGVVNQVVSFNSATLAVKQSVTINLPTGAHTVEINEGVAATGCTVTALTFDGSVVPQTTAPTRRLSIFGDSISQCEIASPRYSGYSMLFRYGGLTRFTGVRCGGRSGGSVGVTMNSSPARDALVTEIVSSLDGTTENVVMIALGINDWFAGFALATFNADVLAFLTALRVATAAKIYYLSPFAFGPGTTNSSAGYSLSDMASGIQTACNAVANCTFISGTTMVSPGNTGDGIHPNAAGHLEAFNALRAIL